MDLAVTQISGAMGFGVFSPRHATAGAAMLLIGGPASIITGYAVYRSRHPVDQETLSTASEILKQSVHGMDPHKIKDKKAAILLRRLGLVTAKDVGGIRLVATEKGKRVLYG